MFKLLAVCIARNYKFYIVYINGTFTSFLLVIAYLPLVTQRPCLCFHLQSNPERYVKDAFQWMVPFLHRCEGRSEGAAKTLLANYLVGLAQQDLTLPLIIFQHSKPVVSILKHTRVYNFGHVL